ncbi:MAG: DUF4388 domain-containing protein [Pseudomonadota bacterium]
MALKGTLKDFGIADILQLIGHQLKTGVLKLATKQQEVRVSFVDGNVVKAESTTRDKQDLLGSILVRAEGLTQDQLDTALEIQRRTLKRLGDILVDSGYVSRETIRDFTRLQTTETIYKLFLWKSGTYEFEQGGIDYDPESYEPIRAESVLMEGFRMVDEWPFIRKRITSYAMRFEILKPLPEGSVAENKPNEDDFLSGIDDAFSAIEESVPEPKLETSLGAHERLVYGLITPDRDAQKLIDLSRLGEFETCKALMNLLNAGLIAGIAPQKGTQASSQDEGGGLVAPRGPSRVVPVLVRAAMTTLLLALVLLLVRITGVSPRGLWRDQTLYADGVALEEAMGWRSELRLTRAIEVYRLEFGRYPEQLTDLVSVGILNRRDLRYPWQDSYAYRTNGNSYQLRRPFR